MFRDLLQKYFPALNGVTEWLANLTTAKVLLAVGILMLVLAIARLLSREKEARQDWVVENVQVALSVVVVVFLLIRPFLFQAFYIPSGSMEPTLMGPVNEMGSPMGGPGTGGTGDRLLVNKLIYRLGKPQRRDIVVFKAPPAAAPDEKEFIKRVIGLPGETIEILPARLTIDGHTALRLTSESGGIDMDRDEHSAPEVQASLAQIPLGEAEKLRVIASPNYRLNFDAYRVEIDGKLELSDVSGQIENRPLDSFGGDTGVEGTVFSIGGRPRLAVVRGKKLAFDEGHVLAAGQRLREDYIAEPAVYSYGPRKLGPNEYFMMGDNRNNSNDSHSWGPLTGDRVIGRAEVIFWPVQRFRLMEFWLIAAMAGMVVGYQLIHRAIQPRPAR